MYNLRDIRKRKGLSVGQLAGRSGVSAQRIKEYELGGKEIPFDDLERLAKALYVEEWEIKLKSDPPVAPPRSQDRPNKPRVKAPRKGKQSKRRPKQVRVIPPLKDTQRLQIQRLLAYLSLDETAVLELAKKPLDELNQKEASGLLNTLQREIAQREPQERKQNMRRAYLPEGVDRFELKYLQECVESNATLRVTLFDDSTQIGSIVGFGPYILTLRDQEGQEVTINKLAIAYYYCEKE